MVRSGKFARHHGRQQQCGCHGFARFRGLTVGEPRRGTWVGLGSDVGYIETFGQTITGLTAGATYTIAWYAGNFGYSPRTFGFIKPNAINATIDGVSVGTGATLALGSSWFFESATFVAGSSGASLSFQLASDARSYMSIDGISVTAVPEPETYALMLAGLAAVGAALRQRNTA